MVGETQRCSRPRTPKVLIASLVLLQALAMMLGAGAQTRDDKGPNPPSVGEPGGVSEWASNHIVALHETIRIAIEADPVPSAGVYNDGGGLSGQLLHFHPRVGVTVVRWSDLDLAGTLQTGGTFQRGESAPNDSRTFQVLPIVPFDEASVFHPGGGMMPASPTLIVMRWDDAWVMVEETRMLDFIADLNDWYGRVAHGERSDDGERRHNFDHGMFCLRDGSAEPEGQPDLPEKYTALVCREPMRATIILTEPSDEPINEQAGQREPSRHQSRGTVVVSGDGLRVGMTFTYHNKFLFNSEIRITRVNGLTAEGTYESAFSGRNSVEPFVGQTISTWRDDPVIAESRAAIGAERSADRLNESGNEPRSPRPGVRTGPRRDIDQD